MKELPKQIQNDVDHWYRRTISILATQFLVVIILVGAAWFLAGKFYPFGEPTGDASFSIENLTNPNSGNIVATTLWITILAVALSSFLLRRLIFSSDALRDTMTIEGAHGLLKSLQTKSIAVAFLGVIIAILGFIVTLISGNFTDMLRAAIISAIVIFVVFINFPRKNAWQRLLAHSGLKE